MAFDEHLASRVTQVLRYKKANFEAKKMFGAMVFMVEGKMCIGAGDGELMARIGPNVYDEALEEEGVKEMMFTGRSMKGYIFIESEVLEKDEDLERWIQLCLDFNPKANSSKKKMV